MIFYGLLIGLVVGAAAGGRLSQLEMLQIRWWWAGLAAIAFQLLLFSTPIGSAIGAIAPVAYVLSTGAVLAAVLANLDSMGFRILAAGAVANLAAIIADGGYMPSTEAALQLANRGQESGYSNSAVLSHPNLAIFTDIFAIPSWMPLANVFSIGDVLIATGVAVIVIGAMRTPLPTAATQ
jgi:multisubunit Na+/H+ antiporter MnhE subunit